MQNQLLPQAEQYTKKNKHRKIWKRVVSVLACIVVFCTTYALILPAITLEQTAYCGLEEHRHSEECYENRLICGYDELSSGAEVNHHVHTDACYETRQVLVCGQEESAGHIHDESCIGIEKTLVCLEDHEHTDDCYETHETYICGMAEGEGAHVHGQECYEEQKVLICNIPEKEEPQTDSSSNHVHTKDCYERVLVCQKPEHEHTLACYSDPNADLESVSVWERSVAGGKLTGNWADDVIGIARTQLGYKESTKNYTVSENDEMKGITRYGQWYGKPYDDWDAMFASFCLNYAQIPQTAVPYESSCANWVNDLAGRGLYYGVGTYCPVKGDLIFFDKDKDGISDHVGLVAECDESGTNIKTIEGDSGDCVQYANYGGSDPEIVGYMAMPDNPVFETDEKPDENTDELSDPDEEDTSTAEISDPGDEESVSDEMSSPDDKIASAAVAGAGPIAVESYISDAKLSYRSSSEEEWSEATEETTIPGTAELKLAVDYKDVPLSGLLNNGGLLSFKVPALLRNPTADGTITDADGNVIGVVSVAGDTLTIDFDDNWLHKQQNQKITLINGSFYITSQINLSEVTEGGETKLVLGKVEIKVNFEEDIVTKNGDVSLTKSVSPKIIESEDGDYAEYTLTITAGKDGCPKVSVVDHFTENADKISYVGVSGQPAILTASGTPGETIVTGKTHGSISLNSDGALVWEIGDMTANETRTLHYRVRLGEGYTYIQNSNSKLLTNEAQAYAGSYPKEKADADLEPKAGLNLRKTAADPVRNEDGSYTITYTVTGEANKSNMFTLKNVSIKDTLDADAENKLDKDAKAALLRQISYVTDSFLLYNGSNTAGASSQVTPDFTENGKGFAVTLGDLAPGEAFCIQYQVHIGLEALAATGGKKINITNNAQAFADNAKMDDFDYLASSRQSKYLKYSHWANKLVGEPLTADQTIPIGSSVYDATLSEPVPVSAPPENFIAPAGSYLYTVLVNELGDWNVTSASMTDTIDGAYMQFVGYVKVEALDVNNSDSVVETRWVKVDGMSRFDFTMAQLGITDNKYAYRLSYYAKPETVEGTAAVIVKNSFIISGTIIPGTGSPFILTGVTASKDVVLKGGNTIEAKKLSWYYEGPASSAGDYSNGTLYWAIKVDGDAVRAGTYLQDYLTPSNCWSFIRKDSLVGVYMCSSDLTGYTDLESALSSGCMTEVEDSYYSVNYVISEKTIDESSVTVKMEKTLPLDGKSLYIIVKTAPAFLPPHAFFGETLYYHNKLRTSDDGQKWTERGHATDTLYEGTNLWKKVGAVFKFDGETISETASGSRNTIVTSKLGEPGLYVSWDVTVNYAGELSGRYRLKDTLPDGMELSYVRLQQRGNKAKNNCTEVIQINDLGADYLEHSITAKPQGESSELTTWYYTDGDAIVWDVDKLLAGRTVDNCAVTFQIVCRVTDPDVLLGGETKNFTNQITLYGEDGRQRDIDTQTVSVTTKTLKKTVKQAGRTLPFTITVNDLGEDLLAGSDKLTVVDTLSDTLKLDPTSITVINTKTQAEVPFTASVDGNTLYVVIPDGQPLTISYKTKVLAKPGESTSIQNSAHWEGYAITGGESVQIKNYKYSVGGTAGGSATPRVEIVKYDSSSVNTFLAGAEFEMAEGTMENGSFTPAQGKVWTGTTDASGRLSFGADQLMAYNTVYRITEKKAPDGFVLDDTPIYFLVAKANTDGNYPTYPDGVDVWYESDTYECRVGNRRGTATVEKLFKDLGQAVSPINGTYRFGIYDTENPAGDPMQTVTLTFVSGQAASNKAVFTNLELDKTYYIYELDDNGKPISAGATALVDGKKFHVTYSDGSAVTIAGSKDNPTVTVTNSVSYQKLPETGGIGTTPYTAGGLLVTAAAAMLLLLCNYKKRRETSEVS